LLVAGLVDGLTEMSNTEAAPLSVEEKRTVEECYTISTSLFPSPFPPFLSFRVIHLRLLTKLSLSDQIFMVVSFLGSAPAHLRLSIRALSPIKAISTSVCRKVSLPPHPYGFLG